MLTDPQLQTLKADILADPILAAQPMNDDGNFFIKDAYNLDAVPAFVVWKTAVPTSDVKKAVIWTEFIGRSDNEQRAFTFMLSNGFINAADANVRQGINDCFSGPSGQGTRAALIAIAKRNATRAEKLFASGTGSDASPATMSFEGSLTLQDVSKARNLP